MGRRSLPATPANSVNVEQEEVSDNANGPSLNRSQSSHDLTRDANTGDTGVATTTVLAKSSLNYLRPHLTLPLAPSPLKRQIPVRKTRPMMMATSVSNYASLMYFVTMLSFLSGPTNLALRHSGGAHRHHASVLQHSRKACSLSVVTK